MTTARAAIEGESLKSLLDLKLVRRLGVKYDKGKSKEDRKRKRERNLHENYGKTFN